MILVDTSVWIDFFRRRPSAKTLADYLLEDQVTLHPWVFGELMVGDLGPQRLQILQSLHSLPELPVYAVTELSDFVEQERLYGSGLSLVDLQLLYVSILHRFPLWTHDTGLSRFAKHFDRSFKG